jgi:GxxExxY protein
MKLPLAIADRREALDQVTSKIIGSVHEVSNTLGSGFLEKVYENALAVELRRQGLIVVPQQRIEVLYKQVIVGDYIADLLVEECVIVEVKCARGIDEVHSAQCLNYLKATGLNVCLLVNFGAPKAIIRRIVHNF